MNPTHTLAMLTGAKPLAWLLTLLLLYFGGERRATRLKQSPITVANAGEQPPDYRALGIFAGLKLLSTLARPILHDQVFPLGMAPHTAHVVYAAVYWALYLLSTVCVFFVIGALLKNSLSALPGLSAAAMIVYRWAAVLALVIASTAHIPVFGIHNATAWISEVTTSFALCVCSFEISILVLLCSQLSRLGMCLRSRPVGLVFGLLAISFMNIVSAVAVDLPARAVSWIALLNEAIVLFILMLWAFYIILPEPKRSPHSLPITSRLMRWDQIAMKLELNGRQAEQTPFIAGVQLIVDGILDKYKIGSNL